MAVEIFYISGENCSVAPKAGFVWIQHETESQRDAAEYIFSWVEARSSIFECLSECRTGKFAAPKR